MYFLHVFALKMSGWLVLTKPAGARKGSLERDISWVHEPLLFQA